MSDFKVNVYTFLCPRYEIYTQVLFSVIMTAITDII